MKFRLIADSYGDVSDTKNTDDYEAARRFYMKHDCVRAFKDGKKMCYPASDRYFKSYYQHYPIIRQKFVWIKKCVTM